MPKPMTLAQYRAERAGILEGLAAARREKVNHPLGSVSFGVVAHAEHAALHLLGALRAEFYRGQRGAVQKAQGEAFKRVQAYLRRQGVAA